MAKNSGNETVEYKGASTLVKVISDVLEKTGVIDFIRQSLEQVRGEHRSITITIQNESSADLKDGKWYPHRGKYEKNVCDCIKSKKSATIIFTKEDCKFFGVSGYVEYAYCQKSENTKKNTVTVKKKRNMFLLALLYSNYDLTSV